MIVLLLSVSAFAQNAVTPSAGYASWSREQLLREQVRLTDARPGLTLPVLLFVFTPLVTAGVMAPGLAMSLSGSASVRAGGTPFWVAGAVVFAVGITAAIILLVQRGPERARIKRELNIIDDLLDNMVRTSLEPGHGGRVAIAF